MFCYIHETILPFFLRFELHLLSSNSIDSGYLVYAISLALVGGSSFEFSYVFLSWSEDMHMLLLYSWIYFDIFSAF